MEKNIKNISGVSLVEVMISMFIIAMLLIAIVAVFPRMMAHRKGIHESDQAKIVATEVLDGLQALSDHPDYVCGAGGFATANAAAYSAMMADRPIGAVKYEISVSDPNCAAAIRTIDVTVEWNKGGRDHKVTVTGAIR